MTKKLFLLIAIVIGHSAANSFAATIPAETTLVVQTLNTIHSNDRVGRTFTAQLNQNVVVNGKVVLQAGTKFHGKIEASQWNPRNSQQLTLNLTDVLVNGRTIPIKTVSGFQVQHVSMHGGARARGISVGPFLAPHGTRM